MSPKINTQTQLALIINKLILFTKNLLQFLIELGNLIYYKFRVLFVILAKKISSL